MASQENTAPSAATSRGAISLLEALPRHHLCRSDSSQSVNPHGIGVAVVVNLVETLQILMSERRFDTVQSLPCSVSHVDMRDRFLHIRLIRLVELVMCSHLARRLFTVRVRAEDYEEVAATAVTADGVHDVLVPIVRGSGAGGGADRVCEGGQRGLSIGQSIVRVRRQIHYEYER